MSNLLGLADDEETTVPGRSSKTRQISIGERTAICGQTTTNAYGASE